MDGKRDSVTPQNGQARMISLIDFENTEHNIFRVVNQFTAEYTDNGRKNTQTGYSFYL